TVALGVMLLHEKVTPLQLAGIGLAIVSVVMMTWSGRTT
ncbi:MAG: EamA family transporter RarD, partial [Alphaproteobacteria bacterium]|nr:EamA family transporter RarD [Alphaproteobacteria bacterium]